MGEKLKLILKNPRFILACKGLFLGALFWFFMHQGGWFAGIIYVGAAGLLYFTPLFNVSAYFPFFVGTVLLSLAAAFARAAHPLILAFLFAGVFAVIFGAQNFILTQRVSWMRASAYLLSYLCLLLFFMQGMAGVFWFSWIALMILLGLFWQAVIPDRVLLAPALVVVGELAWVVSWLPIGFLSSANLVLLTMLFVGDGCSEGRIRWKHLFIFAGLIAVVLLSSYWKL